MSNLRPPNSDKAEITGSTIGFRFYANEEELEEVQSKDHKFNVKEENVYLKIMSDILKPEVLDGGKVLVDTRDTTADALKDQRNFLGKRSISVDSASESSFSTPVERWKKFSELKEKITKTVEEKISEMKMERNVLGKTKLIHSKENSSVSDSEDLSESSKVSTTEQEKDMESHIDNLKKTLNESSEAIANTVDTCMSDDKKEVENNEGDSELRNRKSFTNFSQLLNLPITIAVAKVDDESNPMDDVLSEDIESGVEADEALNNEEQDFLGFINSEEHLGRASGNPPFQNTFRHLLNSVAPSQTQAVVFLLLFLVYIFYPLPEFFKGCLLSFLLITLWGNVKYYIKCDDHIQRQVGYIPPDYKSMSPLKVPKSEIAKGVWFNEYEQETYDPDYYSVTQTVPAYLELEGSILTISRARGKIRRRATYDEPEYKLPIIGKRVFNITGCNIYLLPEGLTRKRLFSKKYPIVIFLKRDSLIYEIKNGKEIDDKELLECDEFDDTSFTGPVSPRNRCTLFLFARCDRQKEEWFRRLLEASKTHSPTQSDCRKPSGPCESGEEESEVNQSDDSASKEPTTPFEDIYFNEEAAVLEEYYAYMAKFARIERPGSSESEDIKETRENNGFSSQPQWFNAFINRVLFDVFRSPYWLSKIQEKVQRKIHSIRMPYYVEDIEVIEMDLGKTGPVFHRVSAPLLDDRGLWFDMDLTFNGLIRLTVQTQLNLIKLQKGSESSEASVSAVQNNDKQKKGKKSEKYERDSKANSFNKDSIQEVPPQDAIAHGTAEAHHQKAKAANGTAEAQAQNTKAGRGAAETLPQNTKDIPYTAEVQLQNAKNALGTAKVQPQNTKTDDGAPEARRRNTKAARDTAETKADDGAPEARRRNTKAARDTAETKADDGAPEARRRNTKAARDTAETKVDDGAPEARRRNTKAARDTAETKVDDGAPEARRRNTKAARDTAETKADDGAPEARRRNTKAARDTAETNAENTKDNPDTTKAQSQKAKDDRKKKKTARNDTNNLMREVSRLAEIAIEEVISGIEHNGSEICPCSKAEKTSQETHPCACTLPVRSPIYDSDIEDSAESSSEDEDETEEQQPTESISEEPRPIGKRYPRNRRSSKRLFKVFENVAQSKYFKSMAQSKYIQKAIAGVSAAKLRLTLEIKSCTGILAINIPPPPSDRFWYGFRKMPHLVFSANPKIGDKAVRFIHIKNYLQKKILYELKKVMVDPNMIDFVLPTSVPARSSSFVDVEEPDLQEETILK